MAITAHMRFYTLSSNRIYFKVANSTKIGYERGVKEAGFFEKLFGFATKLHIGNQEYTVNKKSLAKFLARTSNITGVNPNQNRVKKAISNSFEAISKTFQGSEVESKRGLLLTNHLERYLASSPSSQIRASNQLDWSTFFRDAIKASKKSHTHSKIDELPAEVFKPHIRLVKSYTALLSTLGSTFLKVGFKEIEPEILQSLDLSLLEEMYSKVEALNETLQKTLPSIEQLKKKSQLEEELLKIQEELSSFATQKEKFEQEHQAFITVKMLLAQNQDLLQKNPENLKLIQQPLIHQISSEELQLKIVSYNQKIMNYQTLILDLPAKVAMLSKQIEEKQEEIKNLGIKQNELEALIGKSFLASSKGSQEALSIIELESLKKGMKEEIKGIEKSLEELKNDEQLSSLKFEFQEIKEKKSLINPDLARKSLKAFGAKTLNLANKAGVKASFKTLEGEIANLQKRRSEILNAAEKSPINLKELDKIERSLLDFSNSNTASGKKEVLIKLDQEMEALKEKVKEREKEINAQKIQLKAQKKEVEDQLQALNTSLSLKLATYNIRATEIANEYGFSAIREKGQVQSLSNQISEVILQYKKELKTLEKEKLVLQEQLEQLRLETPLFMQGFQGEFKACEPAFKMGEKEALLERKVALEHQLKKIQTSPNIEDLLRSYFQASLAVIYNLHYIQYLIGNFDLVMLKQNTDFALENLHREMKALKWGSKLSQELVFNEALKAYEGKETAPLHPKEAQSDSLYASGLIAPQKNLNPVFTRLYEDSGQDPSQVGVLVALEENDAQDGSLKLLRDETEAFIGALFMNLKLFDLGQLKTRLKEKASFDPTSSLNENEQASFFLYQLFYSCAKKKEAFNSYLEGLGLKKEYFTTP